MRAAIAKLSVDSRCYLASAMLLCFAACTPIGSPIAHDGVGKPDPRQPIQVGQAETMACTDAADCTNDNPCLTVSCQGGVCLEQPVTDRAPLDPNKQVKGDCQVLVCNAQAEVEARNDDSDEPPADSNPCHALVCMDGQQVLSNASDATPCNGTGTCNAGTCSLCVDGQDCSRPEHCTVHINRCNAKGAECEDTGVPRGNKSCAAGKVCEAGSCV